MQLFTFLSIRIIFRVNGNNKEVNKMVQPLESFTYEVEAGDPGLALRAPELSLVPSMPERAEGDSLSVEERAVLSFNSHPVLETSVAAVAIASAGFAAGALLAYRRR